MKLPEGHMLGMATSRAATTIRRLWICSSIVVAALAVAMWPTPTCKLLSYSAISNSRRSTFPINDLGRSVRNTMVRGTL